MNLLLPLLLLLSFFLASSEAETFFSQTLKTFPCGGVSSVLDVDGNGVPDLICGDFSAISVYFAITPGSFNTPTVIADDVSASGGMTVIDGNKNGLFGVVYGSSNSPPFIRYIPSILSWKSQVTTLTINNYFSSGQSSPAQPQTIQAGFVDHSGYPSIFVSYLQNILGMNLNQNGTFQVPADLIKQDVGSGTPSEFSFALGDLNRDGLDDVVACDITYVVVFRCSGNGEFQPAQTIGTCTAGTKILVADMNLDGYADIVSYKESGAIEYRLNQKTTEISFASPLFIYWSEVREVVVFDVNGDYHADLLATTANDLRLSLWSPEQNVFLSGYHIIRDNVANSHGLTVNDVDGDGALDFSLTLYDSGSGPKWVKNIHPCGAYPCLNGGTCVSDEFGQPNCTCARDYDGPRCQHSLLFVCAAEHAENALWPASNKSTNASGICDDKYFVFDAADHPTLFSPKRNCLLNATGTGAEWAASSSPKCEPSCGLASHSCLNEGTCSHYGTYTCICPDSHKGRRCETSLSICSAVDCQNGGLCVEATGTCDCSGTLFTGSHCQTETISCTVTPCQNGALCATHSPNNITCDCRGTGYEGDHCEVAAEGDCRVPQYACSGPAQCLTDLATDTAYCICGSRYFGATCELDVVFLVAVPLVICLSVALYMYLNRKFPEAKNSVVVAITLTVYDLVSDVLFAFSYQGDPGIFGASVTFIVLPVLFNLAVLGYLFLKMVQDHGKMQKWLQGNLTVSALAALLATTNIELVDLIHCRLFYKETFNAPLSDEILHALMLAGMAGSVLEDIPQLIIQSIAASRRLDTITLLSIVASVLSLSFGILRRLLHFLVVRFSGEFGYQRHQGDDESGPSGLTTAYTNMETKE